MKIFYYQRRDRQPNFGDELNSWLWQQLIPDYLNDADQTTVFVGLGTLLNTALPQRLNRFRHAILFTTGAGYEQPLQQIPPHWHIYALRGPRSARLLKLPNDLAITDGGLLLKRCYTPHQSKQYPGAFMPHVHHANFAAPLFQQVCDDLGWQYIDPRQSVETVLTQIDQSEVLIAEAMHGAIAADALRVPWIPVVTSPRILSFKWQDWCESIGITYRPYHLPPLLPYPQYARGMRSSLSAGLHWASSLQFVLKSSRVNPVTLATELRQQFRILAQTRPYLSQASLQNALLTRLEQRLNDLCQDLDHGLIQFPVPANAAKR